MKIFKYKFVKIVSIIVAIPILLILLLVGFLYFRQDAIVQRALLEFNETISGEISIEGSHVSLFQNFPYISIDLEHAKLFGNKSKEEAAELVHLEDLHAGFNLVDLVKGDYTIKAIRLDKGHIDLTQDKDGLIDLVEMFASDDVDTTSSSFHFALDKIVLNEVNISLDNEASSAKYEILFSHIKAKFKSKKDFMRIKIDTDFLGSIFKNGKPTLMHKKQFELNTELTYFTENQKILVKPTDFRFEHINLDLAGYVELAGEQNIDLKLKGSQENFNLLIAFAPQELAETLRLYNNTGKIYLKGRVNGSMKNGQMPAINAEFGCKNGFFQNQKNKKKLDEIEFAGTFTNGAKRDFSTMKFTMNKMKAKPEAGLFDANLTVENFDEPDIDLKLKSRFNLDFLVKFLNLERQIKNPNGYVALTMNFHDIIDLAHPEKSLEKLNESYYTELDVKNLNFELSSFRLPIKNVNIHADVNGNQLTLSEFNGKVGNSDLNIVGAVSDVPAILHQKDAPINSQFRISAQHIDLAELTYDVKSKKASVDEKIDNFELDVAFNCIAKDLFGTNKLPIGEFILNKMSAKLQNYPHFINEVSASVFIEENDLKIKRFKGKIDESDFMFYGKMEQYGHFFKPAAGRAKSQAKIFFKSNLLKLNNLLAYKNENYLPESIKNETFSDIKLKATIGTRHEGEKLIGAMLELSELDLTTSMHEKRFENLAGKLFFRNDQIRLKNLVGKIGHSDFDISLDYFLGTNDSLRRHDNLLVLKSSNFDLNEIMAIKLNSSIPVASEATTEEKPFKITDVPFMDFKIETDIQHFEYLTYRLDRVKGEISMKKKGTIDFKRFGCDIAGGKIRINGVLDASDSNHIVFKPRIWINKLDLDQTLMRFQNFGNEYVLSENLSGYMNAKINGTIPMLADLTPLMEQTDLKLEVTITEGELKNFKQLEAFSSFFGDKNLNRIRFDTLQNTFTLKNQLFTIPWMTINSSLGFLEIAGEQYLNDPMNMEYYVKIPLKLVTSVAYQKLFKRKQEEIDLEQEDEIQFQGEKRTPYINIKLAGNLDDFSFSLSKDKRGKTK